MEWGIHSGPPTTSTFVPGIFVSNQLLPIPGEERKFKRRKMVALIPACRRECDEAASHAVAAGVSAIEVEVDDTGVVEGDERGVVVGAEISVVVGEGRGV